MEGQKDTESPPSDASTTSTVSPDVNKADDSTSVPDKNVEIRPSPLAEFKALSPKPGVQIQCEKDEGCSVVPPGDSFPAAPFGAPNKVVDVNFGAFAEPSKQRRLFYELSFWVRTMYFLYKDYAINSLRTFPALLCVAALFSGMLALLTYVEKTSISDVEAIGMSWLFFWIFVIPWEWLTLYTQVKQADSLKQKHEPKMTLSRFLLGIVLPSGLALAASLAIFIKHADVTDLATYVWSFPVHYTIYLIVRIISKNHLADRKPFNTKTVIAGLVEALVCSIIYCFSDMMFCLFFYADAVMLTTWDGWGALFVCVCYGAYMYLFTCLYHLVLIPASLRSFKNLDAAEKRQLHVMSAYSTQVFFGLPEVLLSYTCPSMKIFFLGAVIVEISAYMTKQTILKGNLPQDGHDEFGVDIIEDASEYGTSLGKIEIVSISVFHLPKMDTIGSCDPYLMVQIGPRESKTSVRMRSIDASWSEPMIFDLLTLPNGDIPSMRVKCMDRDRAGKKDDFVGQYTITGESLMKIPPGRMVGDKSNTIWVEMLRENGERRIGMDNQVTTVKIDLRRYLPVSEDTLGSIRIVSMAVSNLPKTDRFGLSDPFMVIRMGDVESKTPIKKRKLHAKWTQEIDLDLGAGTPAMNPSLQVDVFDWNLVGTDERVGSTEVTVAELMKLPAMGKPLELKKALGLPSPVGGQRLVTGQDGEAAECILEILRFGPVSGAQVLKMS